MPRTIIAEDKKDSLLDIISQLEDDISSFSSDLECNEDIKDSEYEAYEKTIAALYGVINLLKNEIDYC